MFIFIGGFALTIVVFVIAFQFNQGPIDQKDWEGIDSFTSKDKIERDKAWRSSSQEAIELGKKLYEINAIGEARDVLDRVKQGEYGSSEVALYRVLSHGIPGTKLRSMDHLPQRVRWNMVHYVRSEITNPKSATEKEWDSLNNEGI